LNMQVGTIADASSELGQWEQSFRDHVADIPTMKIDQLHYTESAERLRKLLQSGLLRQTDLRDHPDRFFIAHRIMSEWATQLGPGFGIRFTVQFNLFAGTIVELGGEEQLELLEQMQQRGVLGCFALTEKLAGVNSGLVVNTTCTWQPDSQTFVLNSPNADAHKNWISQGCSADACVVVADLIIGGKSHGPHAFLMEFRKEGQLVPGVTIGDMGEKTIGNDLDNAWIQFDNIELPKNAMLNRYCDISADNTYLQKVKGIKSFDMIGQRLYSGRTVIAASTLVFTRTLFASTKAYSDAKKCWVPKNKPPASLSSTAPQLDDLYLEADARLTVMETMMSKIEEQLGATLSAGKPASMSLVEAVTVAKVKCIETSIELCFRLKQEVGSYALMGGSGFEKMDYLNCCKFAEGDSRILMQKIARDRLMAFKKEQTGSEQEMMLCMELGQSLMEGGMPAWVESFKKVYMLSEAVMDRVVHEWVPESKL